MITVAVIGIAAILLAVQVKALKPEYGIYMSLAVCLVLFSAIAGRLTLLVDEINQMQSYVKLDAGYVGILLKMTGVTYIAELASDLCKDAGSSGRGRTDRAIWEADLAVLKHAGSAGIVGDGQRVSFCVKDRTQKH